MKFKQLMRERKYYKYAECEEGQVLVTGRYKGLVSSKFGDNHLFEVEDEDYDIVLNSAGQLNYRMEDVEEGTMCRVTYKGMIVLEKGDYKGKESHQFDIEVAEEDENYEARVDNALAAKKAEIANADTNGNAAVIDGEM